VSNFQRIFESVVSVDAWRTTFDPDTNQARVHVDVSFLRGKLGDEPESPIRFEVALKRAEIIFVIPANEPIVVVQSSVKREQPLKVKSELTQSRESSAKAGAAANLNTKTGLSVDAVAGASKGHSTKESLTSSSETGAIAWAQSRRANGQYLWELAPKTAKHLLGKVWDPVAEPLLSVRSTGNSKIEAVARVEIRCRREDLSIYNLKTKNETTIQWLVSGTIFDNKMAAAEAFVINALSARNLDIRNFNDPFGEILLADMMVQVGE